MIQAHLGLWPAPRSGDRNKSPASVFPKRNIPGHWPETFGKLALDFVRSGVWRQSAELQKPPTARVSASSRVRTRDVETGWLTLEDSNRHITFPEKPFDIRAEFPFFPKFWPRDFCNHRLR